MPQKTTLVLIKPQSVHHLVRILNMLTSDGLRVTGIVTTRPTLQMVEDHYQEHTGKDYFPWLCKQLHGHPVIAIAVTGENAVARVREIVGDWKPEKAAPGTIRELGRFTTDTSAASREGRRAVDNVVHATSSDKDAERELKIWLRAEEFLV